MNFQATLRASIKLFGPMLLFFSMQPAFSQASLLSQRWIAAIAVHEAKGYAGSTSHQFILACDTPSLACDLNQTTFGECEPAEDKKGESMSISHESYSTEKKSLVVERIAADSFRVKFSTTKLGTKLDFNLSMTLKDEKGLNLMSASSFSGVVTSSSMINKKTKAIELRRSSGKSEKLKRTCPIELTNT